MLIKKSRIPIKEIITIGLLPSFLKIFLYKLKGAKIGKNVSISFGSVIVAQKIEIGDYTSIGFGTIIRGREVKIGKHVKIGSAVFFDVEKIFIDDDAKINELVFAGGPMLPESYLKLGKRTIVMQMSFLNPTKSLIIGDDTGIGGHCLLFTHGSWQSQLDGYPVGFAPVTLGKNVWLPWRIFVMPGVTIGDGATIGADSLVNKDVPEGCLAVGVPAKVIKTPADGYPKKLPLEKQGSMVRSMLEECIGFLRYSGIVVKGKLNDMGGELRFIKTLQRLFWKHRTEWHLYYRLNKTIIWSDLKSSANQLFLSLTSINEDERKSIEKGKAMWIDLSNKCRGGISNDLGEEMVLFLSRYGLRFSRETSVE